MATIESAVISEPASSRAPLHTHKLLSISPSPEDHDTLRHIVADLNWRIFSAETLQDGLDELISVRFDLILCEEILDDGPWTDLLHPPVESPVVVTSRLADARLWCEVLNLGGFDVLAKPFHSHEVLHLLKTITLCKPAVGRVRTASA